MVGSLTAVGMFFLPRGLEMSVLFAMAMPGVYWGMSYFMDGRPEILQETATALVLLPFNLWCLTKVSVGEPYFAPLSVLVHGTIDGLHLLGLYPTSRHVACYCPDYPLMCASLDVAFAATMAALIYAFPA